MLRKAGAGDVVRPLTSSFESAQGGRMMRPVLHSMEHDGTGGDFRFRLLFLEEFSTPAAQALTPRLRSLLAAVRMHNRVRWEVLERFAGAAWTPDEIEACAKAFSRIDREWQAQGGCDAAALRSHYAGPAVGEIEALFEDWRELHDPASGPLARALQAQDGAAVQRGLARCRELNRRFFDLTFPVLEQVTRGGA